MEYLWIRRPKAGDRKMTATAASNDNLCRADLVASIFTFSHVSKTVNACHSGPSMCHGWRVRPSHAKHLAGETLYNAQFATEKAARRSAFRFCMESDAPVCSTCRWAGGGHSEAREMWLRS